MTPLPKKKHTRVRSGRRRGGQKKVGIPNLGVCPKCKRLKQSHTSCRYCGYYK